MVEQLRIRHFGTDKPCYLGDLLSISYSIVCKVLDSKSNFFFSLLKLPITVLTGSR